VSWVAAVALLCSAAAPFRADQLVVPEAIEQTEIPETMRALGVPVKLRAVRSKLKAEPLIEHFQAAFERAGLFVPESGELRSAANLIQVTAFDVEKRTSVSVLLQPNLDGTTTVVIGEANLGKAKKDNAPAFAPVFPGAIGLLVANLEIGQSLSFSANAQPEEVAGFYRETLTAAGYKEVASGQFERQGSLIRIWLKPRSGEPLGVVLVRSAIR
jgi:hypothetical protein